MKIITSKELDLKQDIVFLGLYEEEKDNYKDFSKKLAEELEEALKEKRFSKAFGEIYLTKLEGISANKETVKAVVIGLGKKKEFSLEKVRQLMGKMVSATKAGKLSSFSTNVTSLLSSLKFDPHRLGRATAEGLVLANYDFNKYLAKEKREEKKPLAVVSLQWNGAEDSFGAGLKVGRIIAENTNFVKDLVNEPANLVNSVYLEKVAKDIAAKHGTVKLKVLNKPELKQLGMNALLGVNAGSDNPPKLLILEYNNSKGKSIALVGKGITFDSGGYNLKPTKYIEDMKTDMAGGAAVLGTIKVAAELGLKKNLLGVIPLCENMISGSAQRPGDIVKAYNGKTIEIGNTDAEGRLILADAITYTEKKYNPEIIIDLATLTGACIVALGYYAAGMVGKDENLLKDLQSAGMESGDRVWQLPFYDEYQDWMDGSISELNNISLKGKGYEAGSITAGVFLSKFVEKARWVHLDIAGSAYWIVEGAYQGKGATGSGVRVLSYYLLGNK
ncbi:MAG: leucyl aminopeptidase [Nanoarchaeota archaeon]|nr:leucyl aminopeptidase [Nanoarchaeota archaeon]MBU1643951.1 leucyl aminopeptidase [Nanoarchaeota archaeon]MBU1977388.1 leucyl aminopeptidase [Nanoarchaeota archaeon]